MTSFTSSKYQQFERKKTQVDSETSQQDSGIVVAFLREIKYRYGVAKERVNSRSKRRFAKHAKLSQQRTDGHLNIAPKAIELVEQSTSKSLASINKTNKLETNVKTKPYSLTNLKFEYPAPLSQRSEIIHHFSVLTKYLKFGIQKKDFEAEDERSIIEAFERLNEDERSYAYEELKTEYYKG